MDYLNIYYYSNSIPHLPKKSKGTIKKALPEKAELKFYYYIKYAGMTGFEPAVFALTGRRVKPGYTTSPIFTRVLLHQLIVGFEAANQTQLAECYKPTSVRASSTIPSLNYLNW